MTRLAIIATHPIQYQAPWFTRLAAEPGLTSRVFYLWDPGARAQLDREFGRVVTWDVPLLEGYDFEFVPNLSRSPGTDRFFGLHNPSLFSRVRAFAPDAVLMLAYRYRSLLPFIFRWRDSPILFRGDSHRLGTARQSEARRRTIQSVFRHFAACLYVGSANYEYFRRHGIPADRLFFCPHAVERERFFIPLDRRREVSREWRTKLAIPDDHAVVLFVGKLQSKKCPVALVRAFREAALARASLVVVGSGPLEEAARDAASGATTIHFASFLNQSELPQLYAMSDILVLPSKEDETWGLVANEAMHAGNALLLSDRVGAAHDLLTPGKNGLMVPAEDEPALGRALREALSDRERLAAWGRQSQEIVERYSFRQMTLGLLQALGALGISASTAGASQ